MTWGDGESQRDQNFESVVSSARARADALLSIRDSAARRGRFGLTTDEILQRRNDDLAQKREVILKEDRIRAGNGHTPIFPVEEPVAAGAGSEA